MKSTAIQLLCLLFCSNGFAITVTSISATGHSSGMSNWVACTTAESLAQDAALNQAKSECKGKASECEFTDNGRRLSDENFVCAATCNLRCTDGNETTTTVTENEVSSEMAAAAR
jgi:hypothetical protein